MSRHNIMQLVTILCRSRSAKLRIKTLYVACTMVPMLTVCSIAVVVFPWLPSHPCIAMIIIRAPNPLWQSCIHNYITIIIVYKSTTCFEIQYYVYVNTLAVEYRGCVASTAENNNQLLQYKIYMERVGVYQYKRILYIRTIVSTIV